MKLARTFLLATLSIIIVGPPVAAQKRITDLKPTVILISLDGFRWDYLDKYNPPTLNGLAKRGVRAKWMIPSFPTKTFPNHYTVATGLYPQNHGIVENNVYDFGEVLSMSNRKQVEDGRWWGGEPIWVTAEKQGQRAAAFFYPGTEARIDGIMPTTWRRYNGRVPNDMRVDKILSYLDRSLRERPTILTMYFSTVDDVSHEFGPESEETRYAVHEVDGYIKRLVDGLRIRGVDRKVNLIITSDHGMATYYPRDAVYMDDHFNVNDTEKVLWSSEIVQIFPKAGKLDEIYSKVGSLDHATCWKKADIPSRLNYNSGARVAPIVCSPAKGWQLVRRQNHNDWLATLDDPTRPRGAHGYDNRYQEMQATFIAHGEAFKSGYVAEPFENVHVYELMCRILGLKPAKNDGNIDRVKGMLAIANREK